VRWVDKGPERAEALVSVSSDGRVTQWSMSKGLECSDLIKLKRVSTHKKVDCHHQQTQLVMAHHQFSHADQAFILGMSTREYSGRRWT
jgi:hypothetical protein